jgi:hypothetical protein
LNPSQGLLAVMRAPPFPLDARMKEGADPRIAGSAQPRWAALGDSFHFKRLDAQ